MRNTLKRRVIASVLAVVMVLGLLPMQFFGGAVEVLAADSYKMYGTDMAVENSTGYTTEVTGQAITEYFTLVSDGGATKVDGNNKTFSVDGESVDFTQRIKLYKSTTNPGKIAFTTSGAATVLVAAMSGGSGFDIPYGVYDAEGNVVGTLATAYQSADAATTANGVGLVADSFAVDAAGTYYIYSLSGDKGLNVYYVEVAEVAATPEEPTSEAPTEAPTEEPTTEAPTEAPTQEPTTEAPTQEPTTEAPTQEPTSEAPTQEPTTEAPTQAQAYVDGFTVDTAVVDTTYAFDFGANYDKDTGVANSHTKGLFSFNAGNKNAASYHSTQYGIEFKQGNMLTFSVAGDTTIVIGGDSNSNSTSISATATNGTVNPTTLPAKTAGHASLEDCLSKGNNTLIYSYDGEAGTVTLTVDDGKAYICYVAIIPGTTEIEEEVKVTVSGKVADAEAAVDGVAGGKLVFANPSGVKTEATINADGTYSVELVVGVSYTVSIDGVDYTLEGTLDLTEVTANVTDNNYTATYVEPPKTTDMSPTVNPLLTVVKSYKVGYEGETGSYTQNANNSFTIVGGGQFYGKDEKYDSLYTAGFKIPEGAYTTVTAKLTLDLGSATTGMAGIYAANDITEPDGDSAAAYYDVSKAQWRAGRRIGGAGGASNAASTELTVYVKYEIASSISGTYTTIATDPEFTNTIMPRKGNGFAIDPTYIGFFANEGMTLTVSDITIVTEYTEEGATAKTKKMVYSSAYGELIPTPADSASTGGTDVGMTFTSTVDGNEVNFKSVKASTKGDIRSNKGVNYWLFPKTTENWTIQTDVMINSLDTGTDKHGVAVGVTGMYADGTKLCGSWFQVNKNKVMQHNYNVDGSGNGGNPKSAAIIDFDSSDGGTTYTMSYSKNGAGEYSYGTGESAVTNNYPVGYALMNATDASGNQVVDGTAYPFDYTNGSASYQDGATVQYALAVCAIDVVVSNLKLVNADGYIIYDMNDYYIVKGVAPVVAEVTAEATEDRTAIDLAWTLDPSVEGKGNVKYLIQVSVDDGEYVKAGESKVCSFSYPVKATGNYKFKVWAVSGESSTADSAKESNGVNVIKPLDMVTLTATGDADSVNLSWTLSEGATSYDVYRADSSDGEFKVITTVNAPTDAEATTATYDDTAAEAEMPVYYYVVAKSDSNTSNPCDTMQALVSAGHSYDYLVGTDANDLTITSKTNDTFFAEDGAFEIKGSYKVAGSAVLVINGVAGEAVECAADTEVTFTGTLEDGRNDVEIIFTNADGKKSREVFNFVVNPYYDILVDAAFAGTEGEGEVPTYKTIGAALATIPADNAKQKVIFVKNGNYEERVVVTAPNVSILGEDNDLTKQFASVAVADKTATGMWDRNAMYVDSTANNFTLENIWVENSFAYTNGSDQQADALAIVADNVLVIGCNLIGYQDTLLIDTRLKEGGLYKTTNQYFKKCYITGNVDFIYGAGSAAFEDCDVVGRYTSYKSDGCFTAARTYENIEYGLIFNNCRFWSEEGIAAGMYRLARPWGADASTVFLNCYMDASVTAVGYGDMSGNSYKNARFAEYNSSGAGYAVNNDRPLLSATQAEKYAVAKVLGEDFEYETVMANMYAVPAQTYAVTVTAGEGGTATADVAEAEEGATVTLTATPNEGYEFDGWVVVAGDVTITNNQFVMPAKAVEVRATFVDTTPVDPVQAFVERMYTVALGRPADEAGVANWVGVLKDGSFDGAAIAQNFILGEEFKLNANSDEEFVDILYSTFFDRTADEGGKAFWMDVLAQGNSREFVLSNFVNSAEFTLVCGSYGIDRGVMFENGTTSNPGVAQFVERLYSLVMGREADKDGLYIWVLSLTVGAESAESAAKFFFNSEEYALKNTDNTTYVTDLYAVFMNRKADADGLKFWTDTIAVGMSREEVLTEFAKSEEFKAIAASYGLQ